MTGRPENEATGLRMRTCESCGVGLGIMTLAEFVDRFIYRAQTCPSCCKDVLPDPVTPHDGDWLTLEEAAQLFGLPPTQVQSAKRRGLLEWKTVGHTIRVPAYQVEELIAEGLLAGGKDGNRVEETRRNAVCSST